MSDKSQVNVDVGGSYWLALALLIIFFHGDPDLLDALIKWLMK